MGVKTGFNEVRIESIVLPVRKFWLYKSRVNLSMNSTAIRFFNLGSLLVH
jgi:hypothetical protein